MNLRTPSADPADLSSPQTAGDLAASPVSHNREEFIIEKLIIEREDCMNFEENHFKSLKQCLL